MKLPYGKLVFENRKYKLVYDVKSLLSIGFVLSINYRFMILFFGFTLTKK